MKKIVSALLAVLTALSFLLPCSAKDNAVPVSVINYEAVVDETGYAYNGIIYLDFDFFGVYNAPYKENGAIIKNDDAFYSLYIGDTYKYNYHSKNFEHMDSINIDINEKRDSFLYLDTEKNSITFFIDSFYEDARTYRIVIPEGVLIDKNGNCNKKIVYEMTGREAKGDNKTRATLKEKITLKVNDFIDSLIILRIVEYAAEIVLTIVRFIFYIPIMIISFIGSIIGSIAMFFRSLFNV